MLKSFISGLIITSLYCVPALAQSKKASDTPAKKPATTVVAEKPEAGDKVINGQKGPEGQPVYQGVKGGIYYINKSGNKTYLKDNDKIVAKKKGPAGEIVYAGPQGGEYYINKNGNKVYLKAKK